MGSTQPSSLDLQLPGGDRLHAIRGVTDRPAVTIRRHNWELSSLKQLQDLGLADRALTELMPPQSKPS